MNKLKITALVISFILVILTLSHFNLLLSTFVAIGILIVVFIFVLLVKAFISLYVNNKSYLKHKDKIEKDFERIEKENKLKRKSNERNL